ncbi:MAG: hypothetical protein DRP11_00535 [Candidatus Aenigmatarchaeota archaeon]|nr:MAG: hypothetical protein DRP11_00535 [Candidatus Aenigmarchaeota archaeon]
MVWICPTCGRACKTLRDLKIHHKIKHKTSLPQDYLQDVTEAEASNGIKILPVDPEVFIPKNVPKYVPTNSEFEIFEAHLESGVPLLLIGPKGIGKTLSFAAFAAQKGVPIIQFDCSENVKRGDLIGRFLLRGDEVVYQLGVIPTAFEVANKKGAAILVFEELNALTPQMQKVLNQALDWRRHCFIPELNKVYRLKPGVKLLIAATMNPSTYGGVHELNEDLLSRFAVWYWNYPGKDLEKRIITEVALRNGFNEIPGEILDGILRLAKETRASVAAGDVEYALSPRDIVQFCQLYIAYSKYFSGKSLLKKALETSVLGKYEDEDHRKFVKQRIESVFGVRI